jgi:hypothetical protein
VVCHDAGTSNTLATLVATAQLYPELKNSSDMHLVALPMLASNKFPGYLHDL